MKSTMGWEICLFCSGLAVEESTSTLLFRPNTRANPELRFSFNSMLFSRRRSPDFFLSLDGIRVGGSEVTDPGAGGMTKDEADAEGW